MCDSTGCTWLVRGELLYFDFPLFVDKLELSLWKEPNLYLNIRLEAVALCQLLKNWHKLLFRIFRRLIKVFVKPDDKAAFGRLALTRRYQASAFFNLLVNVFPFRLSIHASLERHDLNDIAERKSVFLTQVHLLLWYTERLVFYVDRERRDESPLYFWRHKRSSVALQTRFLVYHIPVRDRSCTVVYRRNRWRLHVFAKLRLAFWPHLNIFALKF